MFPGECSGHQIHLNAIDTFVTLCSLHVPSRLVLTYVKEEAGKPDFCEGHSPAVTITFVCPSERREVSGFHDFPAACGAYEQEQELGLGQGSGQGSWVGCSAPQAPGEQLALRFSSAPRRGLWMSVWAGALLWCLGRWFQVAHGQIFRMFAVKADVDGCWKNPLHYPKPPFHGYCLRRKPGKSSW